MANGALEREDREHIARHDPARVLRECEAKRRIVDTVERMILDAEDPDTEMSARERMMTGSSARSILTSLASAHSDHPDFREEWR